MADRSFFAGSKLHFHDSGMVFAKTNRELDPSWGGYVANHQISAGALKRPKNVTNLDVDFFGARRQ